MRGKEYNEDDKYDEDEEYNEDEEYDGRRGGQKSGCQEGGGR